MAVATAAAAAAAPAGAQSRGGTINISFEKMTLPNGLTVLLSPTTRYRRWR